ncbi:MAG: SDR family NAD(P)-dependent oxidoreductase [Planctomycetota bacterium]|nr:MAG: SDR family NAD(P)-dependent oxidoreductase [Planctomycetota bacterium]REK46520.1 MAG: SDR family NAD(P)-dependent oxidoreductase [Planctomycetota bacterium]
MELTGKRALVTGGSRGIGAAIAVALARSGAHVVINARHADEAAQDVRDQIVATGRRGQVVTADLAQGDEVARCVDESAQFLGGLDVVVHSAGGPSFGRIEDVSPEQWYATFDVHVHGAYHLCRQALPWLKQNREGAIILISSVAGIRGCAGAIAYGTAKGAISQFTRMLARDLADDNLRVNCLEPGVIRTRFHDKMSPEQREHNLKNRIPLHREGTSEQVAEACLLLIQNDYLTGESITIDGGLSMQVTR